MDIVQMLALVSTTVIVIVAACFALRQVPINRLGGRITNRLRNDSSQQGRSYEFEFAARAIHGGDVGKLRAFDEHMSEYGLNVIDRSVEALRASGHTNLSKRLTSVELDAVEALLTASYAMGAPDANQWDELLRHAVRNPLDAEAMVHVIQRGIFDIDQAVDMLNAFRDNPSPALAEGAL
jgi:hypothetical protein